jgi:hypothetical protein
MTMDKKSIEVAKEYGFELAVENETEGFRKSASDGSYWFAFVNTDEVEDADQASHEDHVWNVGHYQESDNGGGTAEIVVTECLPLEIVLQEHALIPAPGFDSHGNAYQEDEDTFTHLFFRDHKGKGSWDRMMRTLKSVPYLKPVFDEGFDVTDTGGGCLVFVKWDDETKSDWMLATENTVFGHPARMDWSATRNVYTENDSYTFGIEQGALADSLARYGDLPVPSAELEARYHYIKSWNDLDATLADISSTSVKP